MNNLQNDVTMLDSDNLIEDLTDGCAELIRRLNRPLWPARANTSSGDVVPRYAVTLNICPNKKMNNKIWKTYDHIKQTGQLQRLEAYMRRMNPSIQLVEMHFEICPGLNQVHFHALYEMPKEFVSTMENFWREKVADKKPTIKPWRYLDIQPIYNQQGWVEYIRKDAH